MIRTFKVISKWSRHEKFWEYHPWSLVLSRPSSSNDPDPRKFSEYYPRQVKARELLADGLQIESSQQSSH